MTDTVELEIAMKREGKSKRETAKALGLSEMGLYKKIQNETEFKASEIAALTDFLGLSAEERGAIFFARKRDFKSLCDNLVITEL